MLLATEVMSTPEARDRIKVCSASGIHVLSIPQYIVANVVNRSSSFFLASEAILLGTDELMFSIYEAADPIPLGANAVGMAEQRCGVEGGRCWWAGVSRESVSVRQDRWTAGMCYSSGSMLW